MLNQAAAFSSCAEYESTAGDENGNRACWILGSSVSTAEAISVQFCGYLGYCFRYEALHNGLNGRSCQVYMPERHNIIEVLG